MAGLIKYVMAKGNHKSHVAECLKTQQFAQNEYFLILNSSQNKE
jgi:hypothetical protein